MKEIVRKYMKSCFQKYFSVNAEYFSEVSEKVF